MDVKIFQIYFDTISRSEIDSFCIPIDNSFFSAAKEYEYGVMRRLYFESSFTGADLYGVFSWKFHRKFGATPQFIVDLSKHLSHVDVLICNPYPQSLYFHNVWQQGERCHPGIISVARKAFKAAGLDPGMIDSRTSRTTECYCNYWLANTRFMDLYFSYAERIYSAIYADQDLAQLMFEGVRHETIRAPWFPFIFERLFSTFLESFKSSFNVLVVDPQSDSSYTD